MVDWNLGAGADAARTGFRVTGDPGLSTAEPKPASTKNDRIKVQVSLDARIYPSTTLAEKASSRSIIGCGRLYPRYVNRPSTENVTCNARPRPPGFDRQSVDPAPRTLTSFDETIEGPNRETARGNAHERRRWHHEDLHLMPLLVDLT